MRTGRTSTDGLVPRGLHPGAWWCWAIGLATAASHTTNPLVLLLVVAVAGRVVAARRSQAPWSRSFALFLKLGLVVVAIRVVAQTVLGAEVPGTVLVRLPEVDLPSWAAGVRLGGAITREGLLAAVVDGLRLATVLVCVGAANALANPKRLLASLPAALYEVGVAVVVALSFAPSLTTSVQRIRSARRLRGRADRGLRSIVSVAMPVLEDALERSLSLAAAMDSRGYGRRAPVTPRRRQATAALTLTGLSGTMLGIYGLLDASGTPRLGLTMLVVGILAATAGLTLGGRGIVRTRYRPDPWRGPEWLTAGTGVAVAGGAVVTGLLDPAGLRPAVSTLHALPLPPVLTIAVVIALLPAWCTPRPPDATEHAHRDVAGRGHDAASGHARDVNSASGHTRDVNSASGHAHDASPATGDAVAAAIPRRPHGLGPPPGRPAPERPLEGTRATAPTPHRGPGAEA